MSAGTAIITYIDPNTSQHVFSLLGPLLACLATLGGLIVAGFVLARQRIACYCRRASWPKRIATMSIVLGGLAILLLLVWRFIW